MKQNDWIFANINNPTFDIGDFLNILDMDTTNTLLLDKDIYLKNNKIRSNEAFQDSNGEFSEDKFTKFYNEASKAFLVFSDNRVIDNYEYSIWDVTRPKNAKVKNSNFSITTEINPTHSTFGIAGFDEYRDSGKSSRELAQNSKIFDTESGLFLDKSVNDISLFENPLEYFKSLWDDPLVYAAYDEDTEEIDPFTGKLKKHKKGEWKVNELGEYYTEKLNGRSLIGKEVVSSLDYLTSENSNILKYDFFDSDGIDKSVGGTIMKNIAAVLPLFIPVIGEIYSGVIVARELAKSMPMLYGIVTGLSNQEKTENEFLNKIAAYGNKFTTSTSDYAKNNIFSFENIGNLISDVATQWGLQSFIALSFANLATGGQKALKTAQVKALNEYLERSLKALFDGFGSKMSLEKVLEYTGASKIDDLFALGKSALVTEGKWIDTPFGKAAINKYLPKVLKQIEKRTKIGQDLSLAYMAVISNTDVYDSILQKGGTPFEAAAIALGSTIGMFAVDKVLGLGELFFLDSPARTALRIGARNAVTEALTSLGITLNQASNNTKKGIIANINKGISLGKRIIDNYHTKMADKTLGIVGKSIGEGLEEVSEELVTDMSKTLGEIAGLLGYFSLDDYGAWDNAFERYAMSMLGGTIGGGIFGVKLAWETRNSQEFLNDLIYLLRQGRKDEIFKELKSLKNRGKIADVSLSMRKDENGTYLTAENEEDSLNEQVYNMLVNAIEQLDFVLNDNNLNLSDDALFDNMVQGEYRSKALSKFLQNKDDTKEISYITNYFNDFLKLANDIVEADSKIRNYESSITDPAKRSSEAYKSTIEKLKLEKEELLKQRDELFLEGSLKYVDKLLFAMDLPLSSKYLDLTYEQFIKSKGKDISKLTKAEQEVYQEQFNELSSNNKSALDAAYDFFKLVEGVLNPEVLKFSKLDYSQLQDMLNRFNDYLSEVSSIMINEKFDFETDEQYESRDKKLETESDEDFKNRLNLVKQAIYKKTLSKLLEAIKKLTSKPIDNNIRRYLFSSLGLLKNLILDGTLDLNITSYNPETNSKIKNAYKKYYSGLRTGSDFYILKDEIYKAVNEYNSINLLKLIDKIKEKDESDIYERITAEIGTDVLDSIDIYDPGAYISQSTIMEWIWNMKQKYAPIISQETGNTVSPSEVTLDLVFKFLTNDNTSAWYIDPNVPETKAMLKTRDNIIKTINEINVGFEGDITNDIDRAESGNDFIFLMNIYADEDTKELEESYIPYLVSAEDIFTENDLFSKIKNVLDNDVELQLILEIDESLPINNEVIPFINFISKTLRDSNIPTEDILKEIYTKYLSLGHLLDFELSGVLLLQLKDILSDIELAQNFIYAASLTPTYNKPIGHNKSLNEFAKNHSDVYKNYEELPEIDEKVGLFLISELLNYSGEIKNWIYRHELNISNRNKRFENSEKALLKTQLDFFDFYKDKLKVGDVNLLDGFEALSDESGLTKMIKTHMLLNRNYKKLKDAGKTDKEIIRELFKEDNYLVSYKDLSQQKVAKLDEHLKYGNLTDYDKFLFIISSLAINDLDYYENLLLYINDNLKFGPIAILEHVSRLQLALQSNPELINEALAWIKEISGTKLDYLPNTTISIGSAGSGKTTAISAVSTLNGENTWVTGPTKTQVDNLHKNLPKAKPIDNYLDLVTMALGKDKAAEFLAEVNSEHTKDSKYTYFQIIDSLLDNYTTSLLIDDSFIQTTPDSPKNIVIDEATHIPQAVISLLSRWARKNNINLLLLGDNNLNGKLIKDKMRNIEAEQVIAWRTPKLFISLRDNNTQKLENLNLLNELIDLMDVEETSEGVIKAASTVLNRLSKSSISFHTKTKFVGDYISEEVSDDILKLMNGSIAIITDKSDSKYVERLSQLGKEDVELINPIDVQGSEYDFVIIDYNLGFDKQSDSKLDNFEKGVALLNSLKNLYTMISRSRSASIITDTSILNVVRNKEDLNTVDFSISNLVKLSRDNRISLIKETIENIKLWKQDIDLVNKPLPDSTNDKPTTEPDSSKTEPTLTEKQKREIEELFDEEVEPTSDVLEDEKELIEDTILEEDIQESLEEDIPVRVYGNVSYSGIDTSGDVWSPLSNSDLGIFLNKDITSASDKFEAVLNVYELKSLFLYGSDYYGSASKTVRDKFSKKAIEDAEFWVTVKENSPSERLIGLTTLENDPDKKLINGKIVKVVAKIKGKDGKDYIVSLGGLANPKTWEANKLKIKDRIDKRIAKLEDGEEKTRLINYKNKLDDLIELYNRLILDITENNKTYRINKPKFSGLTDLISADVRLEDINSDKSSWDNHTRYAKTSDIYIEDGTTQGIPEAAKGRAVVYVSSNPFVKASDLRERYIELKQNTGLTVPDVRMVILDNAGISFESLRRHKYVSAIYQRENKGVKFFLPFESERVTPKMYIAMWNFRSNLTNFLDRYNEFRSNESKGLKNYTDEQIVNALKQDNELYNLLNGEYLKTHKDSMLSETEYRQQVLQNPNLKPNNLEILEKIWNFNDSLANTVRQFRLGYNSKHGAYLRSLTNLGSSNLYENKDNVIGVYITPKTANNYKLAIDLIFEHVIDKVITPISDNIRTYIDKDLAKHNTNWFKELSEGSGTIKVEISDPTNTTISPITILGKIKAGFPVLINNLVQVLERRNFESFFKYFKEDKLKLKSFDPQGNEIDLAVDEIKFDETIVPSNPSMDGVDVSEYLDEGIYISKDGWFKDWRYDDMFNLMFHGLYSTSEENNFGLKKDIRATDAIFKYGFFIDPVYAEVVNNVKTHKTVTNRKLFKANKIPGLPQFTTSLKPYLEVILVTALPTNTTTLEDPIVVEMNKQLAVIGERLLKKDIKLLTKNNNSLEVKDLIFKERYLNYFNTTLPENLEYIYINGKLENIDLYMNGLGLNSGRIIDNGVITYEFTDGTIRTVQLINKEIIINAVNNRLAEQTLTIGTVVTNTLNLFNELKTLITNEEILEGLNDINTSELESDISSIEVYSLEYITKINNLISNLEELKEYEDEEANKLIDNTITLINNIIKPIDNC